MDFSVYFGTAYPAPHPHPGILKTLRIFSFLSYSLLKRIDLSFFLVHFSLEEHIPILTFSPLSTSLFVKYSIVKSTFKGLERWLSS